MWRTRMFAIVCVLFSSRICDADTFLIDFNAFYFSDAASISSTASASTRTFYDFMLGVKLDKKAKFYVGWNYGVYGTTSSAGSTTENYSSTQMGPKFLWFLGKDKNWVLGAAYNLVTNAAYSTGGSSSQTWRGTAIKADFGYVSWLSDSWTIGGKMNYSSATFSEKFTNGDNYEKVTNTRVHIFPSLYMGLHF